MKITATESEKRLKTTPNCTRFNFIEFKREKSFFQTKTKNQFIDHHQIHIVTIFPLSLSPFTHTLCRIQFASSKKRKQSSHIMCVCVCYQIDWLDCRCWKQKKAKRTVLFGWFFEKQKPTGLKTTGAMCELKKRRKMIDKEAKQTKKNDETLLRNWDFTLSSLSSSTNEFLH